MTNTNKPNSSDISERKLKRVLQNSYRSRDEYKPIKGYNLDKKLSNREAQVYVPKSKKKDPIVSYTGTRKLDDIATDMLLGVGGLKATKRFHDSKALLHNVHAKYGKNVITTGNSLGGTLAREVATPNDKVLSHNPAITYNSKGIGKNEKIIRSNTDLVSGLSILKSHARDRVKTLTRNNPLTSHFAETLGHSKKNV